MQPSALPDGLRRAVGTAARIKRLPAPAAEGSGRQTERVRASEHNMTTHLPFQIRLATAAIVAWGTLLGGAVPAIADWRHAHGSSANTGFVMIDTEPARWPMVQQPLGALAPGANPVIGPDGTVYIGTLQGQLRAFHADGTPYWTRQINSTHGGIFAAPVVLADGTIYVVSTIHYRDHRDGVTNERNDSFLHKFTAGGAWIFASPFPEEFSDLPARANRGATTAPPNVWRFNGTEAIIVPAAYRRFGYGTDFANDIDVRLIAFSTDGAVLANQLVTRAPAPTTTTDCDDPVCLTIRFYEECFIGWPDTCNFVGSPGSPLQEAGFPMPGVAIRADAQGAAPLVMVTDGRHDKVAYAFSPQAGFSQLARSSHLIRQFTTPPVVRPNGDTVFGTRDGYLTVTTASLGQTVSGYGLGTLTAAPTRLANGRLVVVSREGTMTLLGGSRRQVELGGESIAAAAASCNHVFVATTNEFATYSASTLALVASVPWIDGGRAAPVIGPSGHVYAIAANTLYVFPPPWRPVWDTRPPSCALLPPI
jgi:outer membrane protein assembly factor BamB